MTYKTIQVEILGAVATIWLNRPQVRNALDDMVIAELSDVLLEALHWDDIRVLVVAGRGDAFCAGAI